MIFILCIIAGLLLANLLSLSSNKKKPQGAPPPSMPYGYDNRFQDYQSPKPITKNIDTKETGLHKEREQNQQRIFYTLLFLFIIIALLLLSK